MPQASGAHPAYSAVLIEQYSAVLSRNNTGAQAFEYSVAAVLKASPWLPAILFLAVPPLLRAFDVPTLDKAALILGFIGLLGVAAWVTFRGRRWMTMLRLALTGTPPNLLGFAVRTIRTWPQLVHANNWASIAGDSGLLATVGNRAAAGPRIIRIEEAPAGVVVTVTLTPACGADRISGASTSIADAWGAESVEVSRPRPNEAALLARLRDPLAGTRTAFKTDRQKTEVTAEDFLFGGEQNGAH